MEWRGCDWCSRGPCALPMRCPSAMVTCCGAADRQGDGRAGGGRVPRERQGGRAAEAGRRRGGRHRRGRQGCTPAAAHQGVAILHMCILLERLSSGFETHNIMGWLARLRPARTCPCSSPLRRGLLRFCSVWGLVVMIRVLCRVRAGGRVCSVDRACKQAYVPHLRELRWQPRLICGKVARLTSSSA